MKQTQKSMLALLLAVLIFTAGVLSFTPRAEAAAADSLAGTVNISSGKLNIRQNPSTASSVVGQLSKGDYITLLEKQGIWWKVEYANGQIGYCAAKYIKAAAGAYTVYVSNVKENVNIRSGPSTRYKLLGTLPKDTYAVVLKSASGWSKVLYHGTKIGYISNRYLSTAQSPRYAAVSLSVPRFRQGDSRWSQITLGASGQSIAKIGCTTCCVAMLESHRTGKTVDPSQMAKTLRYTSGGALYWPSNYAISTPTDYLAQIYKLLQQGKPVIFGGKKASGRQHWVVVTGFTGSDELTAAKFTVNDPASTNRTTLQELLDDYPIFHRMAYCR